MDFSITLRRHWRMILLVAAVLLGAAIGATGAGRGFDDFLQRQRWALRHHAASGQLVIVEIDARSIAAIARWPWPRSEHAKVINRLVQAGAETIAFDVDFSARSLPKEDIALAKALERAGGGVILPTFRQRAGAAGTGWVDSLPFAEARNHASLAAVSVRPDQDGIVRKMPIATVTENVTRPSLSAMVVQASGKAGEAFAIDFAIDPASVPRFSFVDVLEGRVPSRLIAGKHVLVGATAVELGDQYAVPRYGVIPGVVIQALAVETLMQGRFGYVPWFVSLFAGALFAFLIVRRRYILTVWVCAGSAAGLTSAAALLAEQFARVVTSPAVALIVIAAAAAGATIAHLVAKAEARRMTDEETGLPNRRALLRWLDTHDVAAVAVARIASFDRIGAALGPERVGDTVLRVAERLRLITEHSPVFRMEDALLAWPVGKAARNEFDERAAALKAMMLKPVEVHGRSVDISLHLGVADKEGRERASLPSLAAHASEQARQAHRTWLLHGDATDAALDRDVSLLGELDLAVERGELAVLYQPKLDIATGRIEGAEALVRWDHPRLGRLSPDSFIPLAEEHDRILPLTEFVLRTAMRDGIGMREAGQPFRIAVNISSRLIGTKEFDAVVEKLTRETEFSPDVLTLEVTESAAMTHEENAILALRRFRALGIAISMDDYGTGQSTLAYLQRLPLDELKIDRRFVQHVHRSGSDAVLVRSTIDLAHQLGLKVVAEGVEDEECLAFLRNVGCDVAQGYLIGRPDDLRQLAAAASGLRFAA